MSASTSELCEKFFGTKDIYEIFSISKDSAEKEIKKAYYRISLNVHPDRVVEEEKAEATEKFKVLAKLYSILTDENRRKLYDEQKIIDDDDSLSGLSNILDLWKRIFKPLTTEDINNYHVSYVGSETEQNDIKKAYLNGKGCRNYMMSSVPFMNVEDEPRITKIVQEWIDSGEVPEYKDFTKEASGKRSRRHKKYAREAREANIRKEQLSASTIIASRQNDRASNFLNLLKKYGGENCADDDLFTLDDEDEILPPASTSSSSLRKKKKPVTKKKVTDKNDGKDNSRRVINGKIKKRNK